jgi:hypothetical protein
MPQSATGPAHGGAGPRKLSFRSRIDNPAHKSRPPNLQAAIPSAAARRVRLQYLARRLHALGERPLFHFLEELERGAPIPALLERYASLPRELIAAYGGDRFAPMLWAVDGGRP